MLLHIHNVLDPAQLRYCRQRLESATWSDGRITAGYQSARAKNNLQLPEQDDVARELRALVERALGANAMFDAAALPHRIFPPLFNCYLPGQGFGAHIDNAVRYDHSQRIVQAVRTDLSATLFLSEPSDYDGGELVIEDIGGERRVKPPAGDLVLYPASSVHRVEGITRGRRLASFFWIQSTVRNGEERELLFRLQIAIQQLTEATADRSVDGELANIRQNLLRRWTEV